MTDTIDSLTAQIQNYIVAPLNAFGLGGFLFDVQGEAIANCSTEITDHYAEDNRALQDHIAIRPKRITLKGYVGELVYYADGADGSALQTAVQKLTEVSAYLPTLSAAAQQLEQTLANPTSSDLTLNGIASTTAADVPGAANIYAIVKNLLGSTGNQSKQQNAYSYFTACQAQGILMGIQTPWEFLTSMAIESIVAIQPEESIYITDFSITFKQIRIAATQTVAFGSGSSGITPGPVLSPIAGQQASTIVQQGIVPGIALPYSGLPGAQGSIISTASLANNPLANIFKY